MSSRAMPIRVFVAGAALCVLAACTGKVADGVSQEQLLLVRPAMSSKDVQTLLGDPLEVARPRRKAAGSSPCVDDKTWIFAKPGWLGRGIELSARFCNDKLVRIAAERHDLGFYWCTEGECPVIWNEKDWALLPERSMRPRQ